MSTPSAGLCVLMVTLALAAPAPGQAVSAERGPLQPGVSSAGDGPEWDLEWVTIDGGGSTYLVGGDFTLGLTVGQADAGTMSGDDFELSGGFWFGVLPAPVCYANCDGSMTLPPLNINDFICFQARFAAGDPYANCDGSTVPPVLNVNDFICFQVAFAAGCP